MADHDTKLNALADRLEKAPADQQEDLLWEAFVAVHGPKPPRVHGGSEALDRYLDLSNPFYRMLKAKAYESAAMTLVPERCVWTLDGGYTRAMDGAEIGREPTGGELMELFARGEGATPALALAAAALRAQPSSEV